MAEYIEREAIMKFPMRKDRCDNECVNKYVIFGIELVLRHIENLPAADVAPVVRCKDCKHLVAVNVNGKGIPTCRMSGMEVAPAEFCSYGEKMDGGNTNAE